MDNNSLVKTILLKHSMGVLPSPVPVQVLGDRGKHRPPQLSWFQAPQMTFHLDVKRQLAIEQPLLDISREKCPKSLKTQTNAWVLKMSNQPSYCPLLAMLYLKCTAATGRRFKPGAGSTSIHFTANRLVTEMMLSLLKLHHLSTLAMEVLSPSVLVQPGAEMLEENVAPPAATLATYSCKAPWSPQRTSHKEYSLLHLAKTNDGN